MKTFALVSVALLCCACGNKEPVDDTSNQEFIAQSRAATNAMQVELKRALSAAMKEGGPVHALIVCNERAPEIASQVMADTGLRVTRVSERHRSLSNAPTDAQREVLQFFAAHPAARDTVIVDAGETTYLRPIRITTDLCLQCHGEPSAMSADVIAKLAELYPEDQATGFARGDLRGAFVVRPGGEAAAPTD